MQQEKEKGKNLFLSWAECQVGSSQIQAIPHHSETISKLGQCTTESMEIHEHFSLLMLSSFKVGEDIKASEDSE